jgi:F-type H+-transporting ATPase subunit b
MLSIDHTVFIQIANFLLLLLLLNIVVYRPIRGILNKRKEMMSSTEELARNWRQEADKNSMEFEGRLTETKNEGLMEKGNLKSQAEKKKKEMLMEANASVEEKIEKAKSDMQERIAQVRQSLQKELETFSREVAEKILGRGI